MQGVVAALDQIIDHVVEPPVGVIQVRQTFRADQLADSLVPRKHVLPEESRGDKGPAGVAEVVGHADRADAIELQHVLHHAELRLGHAIDHLADQGIADGQRHAEILQAHQQPRGHEDVTDVDDDSCPFRQQFAQSLQGIVAVRGIGIGPVEVVERGIVTDRAGAFFRPHSPGLSHFEGVVLGLLRSQDLRFDVLGAHDAQFLPANRLPKADGQRHVVVAGGRAEGNFVLKSADWSPQQLRFDVLGDGTVELWDPFRFPLAEYGPSEVLEIGHRPTLRS